MHGPWGFLLGKFLPPHQGHVLLRDFTRSYAEELTILVCTLARDPIPGVLRFAWMRELFPAARVVHLADDVPEEPSEHSDFWPIWRAIVKRARPEPIDYVFASESDGHRLAAKVGGRFVPVDPPRFAVPSAGRDLLRDPFAHWQRIPAPVRPYFALSGDWERRFRQAVEAIESRSPGLAPQLRRLEPAEQQQANGHWQRL